MAKRNSKTLVNALWAVGLLVFTGVVFALTMHLYMGR